jgi:cytochrome c oxidase subunit 1
VRHHRPARLPRRPALHQAQCRRGIVFLLLGGIAALLLALTRWQTVHLLPVDWFYRILTFHGLNMLIFWILFFEVAILYFACTTPLNARLYSKQGGLALVRPDARRRADDRITSS